MISPSWQLHYGIYMGMFLHKCCSVPYSAGLQGIMNGLSVNVWFHVVEEDACALCLLMHAYLCVCVCMCACVHAHVCASLCLLCAGGVFQLETRVEWQQISQAACSAFNQTTELETVSAQCSGLLVRANCMSCGHAQTPMHTQAHCIQLVCHRAVPGTQST